MIRKRTSKMPTEIFRFTVVYRDLLKNLLVIYSRVIGSVSQYRKVFKRHSVITT